MSGAPAGRACNACLARSWLLARLAGNLDTVRAQIEPVLELRAEQLIDATSGKQRDAICREFDAFDSGDARASVAAARLEVICPCDPAYPTRMKALPSAPAVYVAGGLERFLALAAADPVAIVGSRRASEYGLEVARSLGRGLAAAGLPVVSGMAFGIDGAAHAGALAANGAINTLAVLPGSAARPYPASMGRLHAQIVERGVAISELPPGTSVRRWMFPARNRLIAALSAITVVVEARERSGALVTARVASRLRRPVGAVPGRVTSPQATGTNALIADGARLVRDPQDVLDALFGAGVRRAAIKHRPRPRAPLDALLDALADGIETPEALKRAGMPIAEGLAALAELELEGYVIREQGGRFAVLP